MNEYPDAPQSDDGPDRDHAVPFDWAPAAPVGPEVTQQHPLTQPVPQVQPPVEPPVAPSTAPDGTPLPTGYPQAVSPWATAPVPTAWGATAPAWGQPGPTPVPAPGGWGAGPGGGAPPTTW